MLIDSGFFIVNKYGDEVVIPINENVSKDIQSKIYGVSYFLGNNYTSGSVLIAEILDIVIVEDIPIQILFKNLTGFPFYKMSFLMIFLEMSRVFIDF